MNDKIKNLEPGDRVEITTLHTFSGFYHGVTKDPVTKEEIVIFATDPWAHKHPTNSGMRQVKASKLHTVKPQS